MAALEPSPPETTWSLLEEALGRFPRREALVEPLSAPAAVRRDYAALGRRVRGRVAALERLGVGRSERVALLDHNGGAFLEWTFAAAGRGAVLVPLNTRWSLSELAFALEDCEARVLVHGPDFDQQARALGQRLPALAPVAADVLDDGAPTPLAPEGPDAPAFLYYTSGTTGLPKGVVLTHANVCVHARWAIDELGLGPEDRWAHVAPMFHLADAWASLAVTRAGGAHVMVPRFEPPRVLAVLEAERVTMTNLVPTMLGRLVAAPEAAGRSFPDLRRILSGGAPIAPSLVERIVAAFGCEYVQTYGMTETSPFLTMSLLDERFDALSAPERLRASARTGRPFAGVELQVVDARGAPVPADDRTVGEIRVRGPSVSPGYWRRPAETAEVFRDGWLYTGDLAVVDARGFVDIVDRKKDVILSGGETIYSTEVEHALAAHPDVLEVAAFGLPDAEWGEVVCAAVAPRPGAVLQQEELVRFCKQRLASYKTPRVFRFLDELPKTGSGKLAKRLLRESCADLRRSP